MLRKLFYLITLFLSLNITAQIDSVFTQQFTYTLSFQPDSTNIESKRTEKMLLLRNKTGSVFLSKNEFLSDSIFWDVHIRGKEIDLKKMPYTRFNFKILKDFTKDTITVYDKIFVNTYKYKEAMHGMKWKLEEGVAKVNGFQCQKATTIFGGRKYIAWFTNQIPIADGPYKFNGLPGLIVRIYDIKKHYDFQLLTSETVKKVYPYMKPRFKLYRTDKLTFFEKHREFYKNIVKNIAGAGFTLDAKNRSKIDVRYKKRNNPIEIFHKKSKTKLFFR